MGTRLTAAWGSNFRRNRIYFPLPPWRRCTMSFTRFSSRMMMWFTFGTS